MRNGLASSLFSTEESGTVAKFDRVFHILQNYDYDVIWVNRGARKVCVSQTCQWTGLEVRNLSISLVVDCMSRPGQLVKIHPGSSDADVDISIRLCAHSMGSFCSLTCT